MGCPGVHGSRALERVEIVARAALRDLLLQQLATPDEIVARVAAELSGRDGDKAIAKAKTRLVDLERRRSRLLDAYESGSLDLLTWTGRDRLLAADMEAIAALIDQAPVLPDVDRLLEARQTFAAMISGEQAPDARLLLTELGARVVIDLDELSARIVVGEHYGRLFPAAVAG